LANKDPNNKSSLLFRQIELNWINAPLNDDDDYIALYLDTEPDQLGAAGSAPPVSVHRPNVINGKVLLPDHYLPVIDFYNESFQAQWPDGNPAMASQFETQNSRYSFELAPAPSTPSVFLNEANKWRQYQSFALPDLGTGTRSSSSPTSYHTRRSDARGRRQDWPGGGGIEARVSLVDECIGYCVAYHSQKRILAKSCLKTYPNWMQDSHIGSRTLTTIAIAGTHNSGTYLKQRPMSYKIGK
jgi:hypothetical protein